VDASADTCGKDRHRWNLTEAGRFQSRVNIVFVEDSIKVMQLERRLTGRMGLAQMRENCYITAL
jgi:hypothetical protein